jgi:hypothetical protein
MYSPELSILALQNVTSVSKMDRFLWDNDYKIIYISRSQNQRDPKSVKAILYKLSISDVFLISLYVNSDAIPKIKQP